MQSVVAGSETRRKKRFVFLSPMVARYGGVDVTLLDMSQTGVQIVHVHPLALHTESNLEVEVPRQKTVLRLSAKVVWTRRDGAQLISGLQITDPRSYLAADLLEFLLQLRRVANATPGKRGAGTNRAKAEKLTTLAALDQIDETKPVIQAKEYLDRNPNIAAKWKKIAIGAATDEQKVLHSVDVLAAWELLNRQVRLEVVEFVFQML